MQETLKLSNVIKARKPPSDLLLFKFGLNQTSKGPLLLTENSIKSIFAAYAAQKIDLLPIDYEHASLESSEKIAEGAPAAAWFRPLKKDDGLYATDIKWTKRAALRISTGEYAHWSPTVLYNSETGEILRIVNIALTNLPATTGQKKIIQLKKEKYKTMDFTKLMEVLKGAMDALAGTDEATIKTALDMLVAELYTAGYSYEAVEELMDETEEEKLMEGEEDEEKLMEGEEDEEEEEKQLSAKIKDKKTLAKILAWKTSVSEVQMLSKKIAELEKSNSASKIDSMVELARKSGKLSKSMIDGPAGKYLARCKKSNDVEAAQLYLSALPVIASNRAVTKADPKTQADVAATMMAALKSNIQK